MESPGVCLPSDMLIEILLRLPAKSIIRFKSVAKTWRHLFQTSSFVSQHYCVNKHKKLGLAWHHDGKDSVLMSVLDASDLHRYQDDEAAKAAVKSLVDVADFHQPLWDETFRPCLDKGLVCLRSAENPYVTIWNPAAREHRVIYIGDDVVIAFGFGFDPLSNDYKVLCIRRDNSKKIARYTIYQLSTDSWRDLKEEDDKFHIHRSNHTCINDFHSKNIYVNGVLYCIVWINQSSSIQTRILAFDLATETSRLIQLPEPLPIIPLIWTRMMKLRDNRLGLWDLNDSFWVLNDDQESWTKQMKIEPSSRIRDLYDNIFKTYFIKELWLSRVHGIKLSKFGILNDLDTGEFMHVCFSTIPWERELFNVYPYEETLVSVHRTFNNEEDEDHYKCALLNASTY